MDQHPIPQNITGFEFKLIGDMTIKQFAYLAAGAIVTYIFFVSPLHPLLRFPMIIFTIILSVGLAFIPVEGRPLDRWISNFVRALFTPSQYLYHKKGDIPEYLKAVTSPPKVMPKVISAEETNKNAANRAHRTAAQQRLATLLQTTPPPTPAVVDEVEQDKLATINETFTQAPSPIVLPVTLAETPKTAAPLPIPLVSPAAREPQPEKVTEEKLPQPTPTSGPPPLIMSLPTQPAPAPAPSLPRQELSAPIGMDPAFEEKLRKQRELEEENQKLKEELETIKKKLLEPQSAKNTETPAHIMEEALAIESKLHDALSEKERLSSELTKLKTNTASQTQPATPPVTPSQPVMQTQERVKVIPAQMAKDAGMLGISTLPNIISGIVKDAHGDILPNIIIEIKDATSSPVRAFKTNKLGQFYGATPLASGKYTIELEDPRNTFVFDVIGVELTGAPFQPIQILAKDSVKEKKVNEREELYQSLFGQQQATG